MRRTDRLFEIMQLFRGGRSWRGQDIAHRLEVSLRTIYRDIDTLVASGVPIEGERGVGYLLREPIFLPPITLNDLEMEALQLGMEIVKNAADDDLAEAADRLLVKINSVLPTDRSHKNFLSGLSVFNGQAAGGASYLRQLRGAISARRVLAITYKSLAGEKTRRTIYPLHLFYWGRIWTCTAWCEMRNDFREFRVDRIEEVKETSQNFQSTPGKSYDDYLDRLREEGILEPGFDGIKSGL